MWNILYTVYRSNFVQIIWNLVNMSMKEITILSLQMYIIIST